MSLAGQPVRVAGAVPALVVAAGDVDGHVQEARRERVLARPPRGACPRRWSCASASAAARSRRAGRACSGCGRAAPPCRCRAAGAASSSVRMKFASMTGANAGQRRGLLGQHAAVPLQPQQVRARSRVERCSTSFASASTRPLRARIRSPSRASSACSSSALTASSSRLSTSERSWASLSRSAAFTRARSCTTLNGLVRKSSAPASRMPRQLVAAGGAGEHDHLQVRRRRVLAQAAAAPPRR